MLINARIRATEQEVRECCIFGVAARLVHQVVGWWAADLPPLGFLMLKHETLHRLHDAIVEEGFGRDALLATIPQPIIQSIASARTPSEQTWQDLIALDRVGTLSSGEVPLYVLLTNGLRLSRQRSSQAEPVFSSALLEITSFVPAERRVALDQRTSGASHSVHGTRSRAKLIVIAAATALALAGTLLWWVGFGQNDPIGGALISHSSSGSPSQSLPTDAGAPSPSNGPAEVVVTSRVTYGTGSAQPAASPPTTVVTKRRPLVVRGLSGTQVTIGGNTRAIESAGEAGKQASTTFMLPPGSYTVFCDEGGYKFSTHAVIKVEDSRATIVDCL